MHHFQCCLVICSLVNMYKELEADIEGFKRPDHGCLIGWAKQGKPLVQHSIVFTVIEHCADQMCIDQIRLQTIS